VTCSPPPSLPAPPLSFQHLASPFAPLPFVPEQVVRANVPFSPFTDVESFVEYTAFVRSLGLNFAKSGAGPRRAKGKERKEEERKKEERKEEERKKKAHVDHVKFAAARFPPAPFPFHRSPWSSVEEYKINFMAMHNIFVYLEKALFAGECFPDPSPGVFPALLTSFAGFWQDPAKLNVITFSVMFECLRQVSYGVEKLCEANAMGVTTGATHLYTHLDEEPVPSDTYWTIMMARRSPILP
jgi:hypothetical protein